MEPESTFPGRKWRTLARSIYAVAMVLYLMFSVSSFTWGDSGKGRVIELADSDRAILDCLLGPGVVGCAVSAPVIEDPQDFLPLRAGDWHFRVTSGKGKGMLRTHSLRPLKRKGPARAWRLSSGSQDILYLHRSAQDSIFAVSEQDADQGIVVRFAPDIPLLVAGFAPGETRTLKIEVKVYDLTDPDNLEYRGSLKLTLSYLGAYEVRVPAGGYEACLIKWKDKGKVGPAEIKDVSYRFFAKGVGMVALIDTKSISAFILYQERSKEGEVLTRVSFQ